MRWSDIVKSACTTWPLVLRDAKANCMIAFDVTWELYETEVVPTVINEAETMVMREKERHYHAVKNRRIYGVCESHLDG